MGDIMTRYSAEEHIFILRIANWRNRNNKEQATNYILNIIWSIVRSRFFVMYIKKYVIFSIIKIIAKGYYIKLYLNKLSLDI